MELATALGRLIIVTTLFAGIPILWAILLNARDRRRNRLRELVLDGVRSRGLRGRIAVEVRCPVLLPRGAVRIRVLGSSPHEMWDIVNRLADRLASRVRLEVTGRVDGDLQAALVAETGRGRTQPQVSLCCYATPLRAHPEAGAPPDLATTIGRV